MAFGLRTRIALALLVVLGLFIVLTELTVSSIIRVSLEADHVAAVDTEERLATGEVVSSIRKPVLLYMVTGALLALVLASVAITRIAVRPLHRITRVVEEVAGGKMNVQVPVEGSGELIDLAVSFNRMIGTIKEQRTELESRLHQLENTTQDLKRTQDELIRAARLASVGTLASGVAHEIGNPIAGILGLLDALDAETSPEKAASYRELVRKEVKRVDKTISDLLTYARPEKESGGEASCAVPAVMDHVKGLVGAQKQFDTIALTFDAPDDLPPVRMSADSLSGVLVNLLLNAGQAMSGTGTVRVSCASVSDWRPAFAVAGRDGVRIAVADDGPGIPAPKAQRIFEPFYTDREDGSGSGLGLAICQSVCDKHGAEIVLDSDYTNGARFTVTIPV